MHRLVLTLVLVVLIVETSATEKRRLEGARDVSVWLTTKDGDARSEFTYHPCTGKVTKHVDPVFEPVRWNDSAKYNLQRFAGAFINSSYSSLRELVDKAVPECAKAGSVNETTRWDAANKSSVMLWQNNDGGKGGFGDGPCEFWIGGSMAFIDFNCRRFFSSKPARWPMNFSACKGSCLVRLYALTLEKDAWPATVFTVPVRGGVDSARSISAHSLSDASSDRKVRSQTGSGSAEMSSSSGSHDTPTAGIGSNTSTSSPS